jgi:ribose 5-phosphate isomerase A
MLSGRTARPYLTDQRNYIVDCHFGVIEDPRKLASELGATPGIAEHGLFIDYANAALVADGPEILVLQPGKVTRPISQFKTLP